MSLRSLMRRENWQILTPGTTSDAHGNPIFDWVTGATVEATKGFLQQTSAVEINTGRETVITDLLLLLPRKASPEPISRATRVGGPTYEVIGEPDVIRRPPHIEARLRLVED